MLLRIIIESIEQNKDHCQVKEMDSTLNQPGAVPLNEQYYDPGHYSYWWDVDFPCLPPVGAMINSPVTDDCPRVCDYAFISGENIRVFCRFDQPAPVSLRC